MTKRKGKTETIIEETGVFKRTLRRIGKKRQQKTQRHKKNPEKVVLCKIGDIEVYVYPYTQPDKVFLGTYPLFSQPLEKADLSKFLVAYNRAKWYLNEEWTRKGKKRKAVKKRIEQMNKAYGEGLNRIKEVQKKRKK